MQTTRFNAICALAGILGALFFLSSSAGELLLSGPSPKVPHSFDFIFDLLLLGGLVGFATSGVAGTKNWLGKTGLALAILGRVLFVVAGLALLDGSDIRDVLLPVSSQFLGLGMILAGISVLQARKWQNLGKFTPLLCGLYPFVVLIPIFAITGGANYLAIAGWDIIWLLLYLALWNQSTQRQANNTLLKN